MADAGVMRMRFIHNFDEIVDRRGTDSKKYSEEFFPDDVIPMWIADTDFKSPKPIIDAVSERARHGVYGYTPGSSRLQKAVAGWMGSRFGYPVTPDTVEFVPGVIAGIICAMRALSRAGDKVILHTPVYPPFIQAVENNGRRLLRCEMHLKDGRYEINFDLFEKQCADPRTRLFILCNPQNPTGRVFTENELLRLGEICLGHDVTVISDEIHSDLVFEGHKHFPFAMLSPRFEQNCVTFINPSKTFNVPGFRTAASITGNRLFKSLIHEVIVSNKAVGENIFGTLALCVAYESCAWYADQMVGYLQGNLELIRGALRSVPGVNLVEPEGTYLFWLDCRGLGMPQAELMDRFIKTAKVGVHDGLNFGEEGRGFVRMNAGCPRSLLRQALEQLREAFAKTG